MTAVMDRKLAKFIVDNASEEDRAKLFLNSTQKPFHFSQLVIALDTAKISTDPLRVGFPFKGLTVLSTSDSATVISARFGSNDEISPLINLKQNNTLNFDEPVNEAYISWAAQPGKSITLLFAVDCVMSIGVATTAITGGIFQQDGTAVALGSAALVADTPAIIAPALSTRKTCTLVNNCSDTIYLGVDATVTHGTTNTTDGIPVAPGGIFVWRDTAALWATTAGSGKIQRLEES